jgi:twinkle protein
MSVCTHHEPCPQCRGQGRDRKGDNLAVYDDGHKYCFACGYWEGDKPMTENKIEPIDDSDWKPYVGSCRPLNHRGINEDTTRKFDYQSTTIADKSVEIANYFRDGELVAQKLRGPDKQFKWVGKAGNAPLWGQWLWKSKGGKRLVITEGEVDAMTVCQVQGGTWPAVSLPSGSAGAVKAIKDNWEFVTSYEEIVLMFDEDDAGRDAAKKVAEIMPPGKCKIATLPFKDANDCMREGKSKAIVNAIWEAQHYSPDEILHVSTIELADEDQAVFSYPWDKMSSFLIGQRSGEITLWSSGTGSGKSTIIREIVWDHLKRGRKCGAIMLEESPKETIEDIISLIINKPVRSIRAERLMNKLRAEEGDISLPEEELDILDDAEYTNALNLLKKTGFYIYDHLGNNGIENLVQRLEFMAVSLGVEVIVLDHITAAATGMLGSMNDNERMLIDSLMKELRSLVSRTGVHIHIVSQLVKNGKAFEEGERITMQDLRGSGSLASVPNTVIALERNRQDPDSVVKNTTTVRVLKNRLTGKCGVATALYYDHNSGRLDEVDFQVSDGGHVTFD